MGYTSAIFSLTTVIGLPILFLILARRKYKIGLKDTVIGALSCFFFKVLANNAILYLVAKIPGIINITNNPLMTSLLSAMSGAICIICWLWVVYQFIYNRQVSKKQMAGFAVGAVMIEVYYVLLNASLSNFVFFYEMNNNTLEATLSQVYGAEMVANIIASFKSYPVEYYLYFGVMALMVLANTYLLSVMLHNYTKDSSKVNLYTILIVIISYAFFYYFTSPISMPFIIYVVMLLAVVQLYVAKKYLYLK